VGAIRPEAYKYTVAIIALSLILTPIWTVAMRRMDLLRRGRIYRHARMKKFKQTMEQTTSESQRS